ncbi:hypothetical protein [Vulcanisaeta sp. EB80]|uniref:hypothetical protein n=1 Tax=Vulcanisaeta sp. EB80 TaxID=1650660 RepID=UPI00117EA3AE|nr:hypothetical protein [Vulcanisaeta sp. EB80]
MGMPINSASVSTSFVAPLQHTPRINDKREDYEPIIRLARNTGSQLIIDRFRPRPLVIKVMGNRLGPVNTPSRSWWSTVLKDVLTLCREYGVECMSAEDEWRISRSRKR